MEELQYENLEGAQKPWYHPGAWSAKVKVATGIVGAAVIAGVIAGAVEGTKASSYPDYSQLNYSISKTYSGSDFFDNFDYYTASDPSDGDVEYVGSSTASSLNLTYASSDRAVIRVDTDSSSDSSSTDTSGDSGSNTGSNSGSNSGSNPGSNTGGSQSQPNSRRSSSSRQSIRLTSTDTYDAGLFLFDIVHSPYGCATWPALWLTDPSNWPDHGEIDVVEAVNNGTNGNSMTLHTTDDCKMNVKRKETGTAAYSQCLWSAHEEDGCSVKGGKATYGEEFNENGGGVYAMELRDAGIRVWMFSRDSIPSDISSGSPDPSGWSTALADFPSTNCDISSHFQNLSIIANIDICGSWAGATSTYSDQYGCPDTCETYASSSSADFSNAYWEFKSFKVYQAS